MFNFMKKGVTGVTGSGERGDRDKQDRDEKERRKRDKKLRKDGKQGTTAASSGTMSSEELHRLDEVCKHFSNYLLSEVGPYQFLVSVVGE